MLTVNSEKNKNCDFWRRKENLCLSFYINMKEIEITKEYKYIGIRFEQSGSRLTSKRHIAEQGGRAMFSLSRKIK